MFKIVRVQYTTKQEYVAKNKENIARVMSDLRGVNNPGLKYGAYLMPDGKSFMHFTQFANADAQKILFALPSFIQFQTELRSSELEAPPKSEDLTLVGSSYDFFS
jgi:hypothetical protein